MREEFKVLLFDRVNKYGLILSLLFIVAGFIVFFINVWHLPPLLPLFYNRPWGVAQLAQPRELLFLLLASLGILVINLTLSLALYKNILLLSRILVWVSVLISLLVTTAVVRVIFLIS